MSGINTNASATFTTFTASFLNLAHSAVASLTLVSIMYIQFSSPTPSLGRMLFLSLFKGPSLYGTQPIPRNKMGVSSSMVDPTATATSRSILLETAVVVAFKAVHCYDCIGVRESAKEVAGF